MSRKIVNVCLFFLAVLLISTPAWSSTSADSRAAVSTVSLTAETGAGFILAGWEGDSSGDCEPNSHDSAPDDAGTGEPNQGGDGNQNQNQNQNQNDDGPQSQNQNQNQNQNTKGD